MSDDSGSSRSSVSESTCYSSTDSEVEEPEEGTFQTDGIRGHLTYLQCYFKHMKLKKYDPEGKIEDRLRDFAPSCRFAPVHAKYVYLTHWKGYKDEDDTWECETQFARNADLKKYKKEHNLPKELETIKYSLSWETDKVNFDLKTKDWNELTIYFADFLESLSGKKPKAVTKPRSATPVPECTEKIVGHLTFLEAYFRHMVLQKEGVPKPETIFNFFLSQDAKNVILHSEYVFKVRSTKDRQSIHDVWLMEKDISKKTSDLVAYKKANRLLDKHPQTEKKFSWNVKEYHFGIDEQYYKAFKKRFKEVRGEATCAATALPPPAAVASKSSEGRKERKTEADVLTETWETPAAERFIQLKERDEAKKKAETDRLKDMVRNINAGAGDSTADEDYEESSVASERAASPSVQKKKKKLGGVGDSATKQRTPSKTGGGSGLRDGKKEKRKSVPVATPIARVLNEDELFPKGKRSRDRASSSGAGGSSPSVRRQRLSTSTAGTARPTPMAKTLLKKTAAAVESKEEEEAKEMQNRMRQWSKEAHAVPKPRKAMKQSIITDDGREVPVAELVKNDLILKIGGAQKVPSKTQHVEQIIVDDIPDEYEDHDYSLQDHFNDEREYEREESAKKRRGVEMGEEYGNNNELEMKSLRAEKKERKKEKEKKRREKEETADTVRKAARTVKVFGWYRHQSLPFCDIPYPRRRCHSAPPCADRAKSQWEQMKRENRTIIRYNAVINRGRNKNPGFNVREFLSDCIRDIPLKSVSFNLKQKVSSKGAVRYVCAQEADRDFLKQNNVFFGVPVNPVDIDPSVYETGPAVATH